MLMTPRSPMKYCVNGQIAVDLSSTYGFVIKNIYTDILLYEIINNSLMPSLLIALD